MYVRKGNLEYFYKIRIFRPIAFKAIIYPLLDLSFWLFTNSPFKKFRRPEKKFSWDGLIFSDLIFVCVNKKNDCSHLWLILSVYKAFNGHGIFSLFFWLFINSPLKKIWETRKKVFMRWTYFSWIDIHLC